MSVRRHHNHQPPVQPGEAHHPPLLQELVQAAPAAHPAARRGSRAGRAERYRQVNGAQDPCRQTEAQSWTIYCKL